MVRGGGGRCFDYNIVCAGKFYWPFLVIMLSPALRLMLVGHWAQIMKDTVRERGSVW